MLAPRTRYPAPVRTESLRLLVQPGETVSAILLGPNKIVAGYVLPHGAVQECAPVSHAIADAGAFNRAGPFLQALPLHLYLRQFRRESSASLGARRRRSCPIFALRSGSP